MFIRASATKGATTARSYSQANPQPIYQNRRTFSANSVPRSRGEPPREAPNTNQPVRIPNSGIAIVTGEDIKDKILPMPQPVVQPGVPGRFPKHWPLAVGKVKFHGEPVVAIVTRDKYVGADAADLLAANFLLPLRANARASLRYPHDSRWHKRLAWHGARTLADALCADHGGTANQPLARRGDRSGRGRMSVTYW